MHRHIFPALFHIARSCGIPQALWVVAVFLPCMLSADVISVSPMSAEGFFDIEVSTNIVFNRKQSNVKEFSFRFFFDGAASNNVQVAFGQDSDGNGILSAEETGAVYGWRRGRYFAENYCGGERFEESITDVSTSQTFSVEMKISRHTKAKRFRAFSGGTEVFADIAQNLPDWLYEAGWNLMCITRRGVDVPGEWFACDIKYGAFWITVR